MKPSAVEVSIESVAQDLKQIGFAQAASVGSSAARKLLSILALSAVVFLSSCGVTGRNNTNEPTNTAPAISLQPASVTVAAGAMATFTATAIGTPTPTVQWQVSTNGGTSFVAVAGATSTTFSFTTTASQNGTVYAAVFANSVSSVTSTAAGLTVNSAPLITTNPASITAVAPANASFTAAATGTPTPAAQWQVSTNGGTTFTNLAGATSGTLTFATTTALNGNQYRAVFANSIGTDTTTAATLTTTSAPAVTTNPENVTVVAGANATFMAAATGAPAPTVQWQVSTNGGTTFANLNGATSPTLMFAVTAGMTGNQYKAVFTNSVSSAITITATLTVSVAPMITTNPTDESVIAGDMATFTAAATGQPAPAVQWFVSTNGGASFNGIVGATSATFSFTASLALAGNLYQAVFTNSADAATTTTALLTVTAPIIVSVSITNPSTSSITLATGGIINFSASITNGAAGTGVNWSVNGVAGGNSTVGTITASTQSGALAAYTAPATAPGSAVSIVATHAGAGSAASAPVTVTVVANHNATLSGQVAIQVRGFGVSGLPFGMVGTFTANGSGALSNVLIDTNTVQSAGGGSLFTSKVAWSGSYSMDTVSHGYIHLTLTSAPTTQMNFSFIFNAGNGSMAEIDTPLGPTAFGTFSAANSSSFTTAAGGVNGTYVARMDGPGTGGNGYNAELGQMTFAQSGSSTTAGTMTGSMTFNDASTANIVGGTVAMDSDGSGHANISMPFDTGGAFLLTAYVSSSGRIFFLESDSSSSVQTGVFRSQTIPSGGFTAANVFGSAMLFEAIGVDPANNNHASVIVGGFSPGAGNSLTGEFDANDGGTIPAGSPVAITGTFTVDPIVPGRGTLTFSSGVSFVFYLRSPGQGSIMEQTAVNTSSRIGQIGSQTAPGGGFVSTTLNGITQTVSTETTTSASVNGIAVINFPTDTTYSSAADGSSLAQSPFIGGTSTGVVAFTDAVRGRGTVTPGTGSIFGAASAVFYVIDNSGALIMISVDPTTLEPQIIIVGN